jgi:hypothetical protein
MMNYVPLEKNKEERDGRSWEEDEARRLDWVPYPEWMEGLA